MRLRHKSVIWLTISGSLSGSFMYIISATSQALPVVERLPPQALQWSPQVLYSCLATTEQGNDGSYGVLQSLTTNRGGQSRRLPSLCACSNASVQSWKKWLLSLNPKSRTIRSSISRCSRRTLVVRLPGKFWVDSCSVFIVEVQQGSLVFEFSSHNTDRLHNVTNHSLLVCLE